MYYMEMMTSTNTSSYSTKPNWASARYNKYGKPSKRWPDIVKEYIARHWKSHAKLVGTIPPSTWRHEYAQPYLPWNKVGISSVATMCHTYMPLVSPWRIWMKPGSASPSLPCSQKTRQRKPYASSSHWSRKRTSPRHKTLKLNPESTTLPTSWDWARRKSSLPWNVCDRREYLQTLVTFPLTYKKREAHRRSRWPCWSNMPN